MLQLSSNQYSECTSIEGNLFIHKILKNMRDFCEQKFQSTHFFKFCIYYIIFANTAKGEGKKSDHHIQKLASAMDI